jgi:hypothetical protein
MKSFSRTLALGFVASFALACMGGSANAQPSTSTVLIPTPSPSSVTGTDPVPPPPPNFSATHAANL